MNINKATIGQLKSLDKQLANMEKELDWSDAMLCKAEKLANQGKLKEAMAIIGSLQKKTKVTSSRIAKMKL